MDDGSKEFSAQDQNLVANEDGYDGEDNPTDGAPVDLDDEAPDDQEDAMLEWAEKLEAGRAEHFRETERTLEYEVPVVDRIAPGVHSNAEYARIPPLGLIERDTLSPRKTVRTPRSDLNAHLPLLIPGSADIARIPSPSPDIKRQRELNVMTRQSARGRIPAKVRMTSVSVSARSRLLGGETPSLYYDDPFRMAKRKVIRWDEATNHRPPLRIDMEGPTCWTYTPRNKPLNETNSPCYSFGRKCLPEKSGGTRTSHEKTWFQTPHIWAQKADFHSDRRWPTPAHYSQRPLLGPRQATRHEPPSYSMGYKRGLAISKYNAENEPSPNHYNKDQADHLVLRSAPSLTHSWRYTGTSLWGGREKTPGPGRYNPESSSAATKPHYPAFTIRGLRGDKRQELGPFSTF